MKVHVVVTGHNVDGLFVTVEKVFSAREKAEEWFQSQSGWDDAGQGWSPQWVRLGPDADHDYGRERYQEPTDPPLDPDEFHEDDHEWGDIREMEVDQ